MPRRAATATRIVLGSAIGNITYQASQILGFVAAADRRRRDSTRDKTLGIDAVIVRPVGRHRGPDLSRGAARRQVSAGAARASLLRPCRAERRPGSSSAGAGGAYQLAAAAAFVQELRPDTRARAFGVGLAGLAA